MPCLIVLGILGGLFLLLISWGSEQSSSPPPVQQTVSSDEAMATLINLSGNLCAKVTLITPKLGSGEHQVNCEEYRDPSKSGTKNNMVIYLVNPELGTVRLMGRA